MLFEKGQFNPDKLIEVTPETVEKFYQFKILLRTAKNIDIIIDLCKNVGIEIASNESTRNMALFRKKTLERYQKIYFPVASSETERAERITRCVELLTNYLKQEGSRSSLWVGGSYGTGKIRSPQSDMDLFFGLPKLSNIEEQDRELKIFQGLENINFIMAKSIAPVEDLSHVFRTGKGLARLSGMTKDGIEIDFHAIGIEDLEAMDKLMPGFVERVRKVEAYEENRTSFIGNKKALPKPGDRLFHYKNVKNEMFKGFYPDNFSALGELVYDPDGKGRIIQNSLWRAIVKGFMFHNQAYERKKGEKNIVINRSKISFSGFLKTLYYQNPEDYSEKKLKLIKQRYHHAVDEVAARYNLTIE